MPAFGSRTRILALVGQNENGMLIDSSEGMGRFFTRMGYQHQVIDLLASGGLALLGKALKGGDIAFAYGFAGVGSQLLAGNDVNLWTALRLPFVAFWFDHPSYHYRQHIVSSPYILNCYHIRDHLEARQKYLPPGNAALSLPPTSPGHNPYARATPWAARQRKFFFAKTAYRPEAIAANWNKYPPLLRDMLASLAEQARSDRHLDLAAATAASFGKIGRPLSDLDGFMGVIQEIDRYIRAWRSDRLARALMAYPVHIYGRGWDYLAGQSSTAEIFPAFPAVDLWRRMTDYRLVANSSPLWRDGVHERVTMGIASGSVTLTDRSEKTDQLFGDLPNYVGFEWNDDDIKQAVALAWDKAHDEADYLDAGELRTTELGYNEANFMRPLEEALLTLGK
ncbi:MAG: hypothetical protein WDO70_03715 [Alphaproteobacteria bacterium]